MQIDVAVQSLLNQYATPVAASQAITPTMITRGVSGVSQGDNLFGPAVVLEISPEGRVAYEAGIANDANASGVAGVEGLKECETCKNRKYVDVSNDPSVSFQTPTHVNPNAAMFAVAAHEGEHVRNEQTKADRDGRKVLSQSVSIHTSICPECGRTYVSGGQTKTVTAPDKPDDFNNDRQDTQIPTQGGRIDLFA